MIYVVWNEKGGAGKTTTTVSLAARAVGKGRRVLIVDLDPQTNATSWLAGDTSTGGVVELITGRSPIAELVVSTESGIDLIPGQARMARIGVELEDDPLPQTALRRALAAHGYDDVFIDTPPTYGEITILALTAADAHVIPTQPAALDLEAAPRSVDRAEMVRKSLNPALVTAAFVVCAYDARASISARTVDYLHAKFPTVPVFSIPAATKIKMAPGAHMTVQEYAPTSPAAVAYNITADAILMGADR